VFDASLDKLAPRGSRVTPAYFVVARRGKNASAPSFSARRRAIRSLIASLAKLFALD
jgi:hypothetical protein